MAIKRIINTSNGRPFGNDDLLAIQHQFDTIVSQYAEYAPIVIAGGAVSGSNVAAAKVLIMDGSTPVIADVPAIVGGLTSTSGVVFTVAGCNNRQYDNGVYYDSLRSASGSFAAAQGGAALFIKVDSLGYARYWHQVPTAPRGSLMWTFSGSDVFDGTTGLGVGLWKGWALANGTNGTPDMGSTYLVGYKAFETSPGEDVGANTKTLATDQLPVHSHSISPNPHNHVNGAFDKLLKYTGGGTVVTTDGTTNEPDLTATATMSDVTLTIGNTGSGNPINIQPKSKVAIPMYKL